MEPGEYLSKNLNLVFNFVALFFLQSFQSHRAVFIGSLAQLSLEAAPVPSRDHTFGPPPLSGATEQLHTLQVKVTVVSEPLAWFHLTPCWIQHQQMRGNAKPQCQPLRVANIYCTKTQWQIRCDRQSQTSNMNHDPVGVSKSLVNS